jgi:hypothetical protein
MSHTVNYTLTDLTNHWPGNRNRLVLLKDACSSVAGFQHEAEKFMSNMTELGVQTQTCKSVFHDVLKIRDGIYSNRLQNTKHVIPAADDHSNHHIPHFGDTALTGRYLETDFERLYPKTIELIKDSLKALPVPIKSKSARPPSVAVALPASPETHSPLRGMNPMNNSANFGNLSSTLPLGSTSSGLDAFHLKMRSTNNPLPPVQNRRKIYKELAVTRINNNSNSTPSSNNSSNAGNGGDSEIQNASGASSK